MRALRLVVSELAGSSRFNLLKLAVRAARASESWGVGDRVVRACGMRQDVCVVSTYVDAWCCDRPSYKANL